MYIYLVMNSNKINNRLGNLFKNETFHENGGTSVAKIKTLIESQYSVAERVLD